MKLNAQDYEFLIKRYARDVQIFGVTEGTSLSYKYMRDLCNRLIEISNEYEVEFPKESKRFSDG
jgi:hypothetical protein